MNEIIDNIWIGDSHDANHDYKGLKQNGITAILNVANDLDNQYTFKDGFKLSICGLIDGAGNHSHAILSALYQLKNLVDSGHTILVHCHEGKSRSAFIVGLYLKIKYGMKWEDTIIFLKSKRPIISINLKLPFDLIKLEKEGDQCQI